MKKAVKYKTFIHPTGDGIVRKFLPDGFTVFIQKAFLFSFVFILLFVGMSKTGWGQITTLNAWSNEYHGTSTSTQNITYNVPAGSNANRILVVAIANTRSSTGATSVTISYGGQTLSLANGDMNDTRYQHTALYYLNESGLDAASNSVLSVTVSGGTVRNTDVFAVVYDGVDQSNPITNSQNYNSTSEQTTFQYSSALNISANGLAIEIVNSTRRGSRFVRSVDTYPTNWSLNTNQTDTYNAPGGGSQPDDMAIRNMLIERSIATSSISDNVSISMNNDSYPSMTAININAYVSTTPPSCTTLISPLDIETDVAVDAVLTWDAAALTTGYYLYFGTDAAAKNIENGTDLGNVTSYTPSTNLSSFTEYYWKIVPYNSIGSATGCSIWSFTTGDVSYCDPSISIQDEYLTRVQINNDIDNSSGYSSGGYGDHTNLSTTLMQGETDVPVSITINTFYSGDDISIWVDWNRNGIFTDEGEDIICQDLTSTAGSFTFNVPANASLGNIRMRIRLKYYGSACTASSCGNTTYGEVEDYTLNITSSVSSTLNVTPISLNFGNVCPDVTAGPENFTITGSNLTSQNVTVEALSGYTYSETSGGTYLNSLSILQSGGSFNQDIFVKFTPTAAANFDGDIVVGGGGANDVTVAAIGSGSGIPIPIEGVSNTVDCPNSTNGTIDLSIPFPIQFDPGFIDINTTLLSSQTAFTLEGWIKVDLASVGSRISLFGQNNAIEFGFSDNTTLICWTQQGGSVSTGLYPSDNAWHHVAVVGNGIILVLYIDGVQVATGGSATTDYGADTNYSSKIGAGVWDATGGVFPGQMIKVGFWSIGLNATEIGNLAADFYQYIDSETGLLAGYNFYEGTGTTLGSEISGTDGTFSSSPTWVDTYSYAWTKSGDAAFSESSKNLSGVGSGTYSVEVTNSSIGCPNIDSWTIDVLDTENPTITCPTNVNVSVDAGLCTASGVDLGTPTTDDNCGVASVTNNASEPYSLGNTTVTWTVTDDTGLTATCIQTVTVEPAQIIDIAVVDLGNSCQSGETGSQSTIIWDINLVQGSNSWTYDFKINDGTSDVQTGTNVSASGNIQISYTLNNETAVNKAYTITLTNVKDNCGVSETNTGNNNDSATLYGVPNTGIIIPD